MPPPSARPRCCLQSSGQWPAHGHPPPVHDHAPAPPFPSLSPPAPQAFALAPLFVWYELLFLLGYRPGLHKQLQLRVQQEIARVKAAKPHAS